MAWHPSKLSIAEQEERRLEGGRLLREGKMSLTEIARHLGVSHVAVIKWKQRLAAHKGSLRALQSRSRYRPEARLSRKQWSQLKRIILKGAVAAGFTSERWTLPRIQQVVKQRWGVSYSTPWLSIRLRALGLSLQRPISAARAKDDELAEAWLRKDWPRIKKSTVSWRSHHVR